MTHLYDTEEPNVISQELLRRSVLLQGPEGETGRLAKEEGIEFSAVRHLRLDFQSEAKGVGLVATATQHTPSSTDILRIENLWQFCGLQKLQLDNNIIENIDGLETLVQLEWLGKKDTSYSVCSYHKHLYFSVDLSFNNIAEVGTGLEALVHLQDLSLAHNQLTDISGFQNLSQLQSLSLASNKLDTLEQVHSTWLMCVSLQCHSLAGEQTATTVQPSIPQPVREPTGL